MNKSGLTVLFLVLLNSCQTVEQQKLTGVVSSATPEATKAGETILNMGGNAIDAAVAVAVWVRALSPPAYQW